MSLVVYLHIHVHGFSNNLMKIEKHTFLSTLFIDLRSIENHVENTINHPHYHDHNASNIHLCCKHIIHLDPPKKLGDLAIIIHHKYTYMKIHHNKLRELVIFIH